MYTTLRKGILKNIYNIKVLFFNINNKSFLFINHPSDWSVEIAKQTAEAS